MLAAECVCGILKAEHSVIRQTITTIAEVLAAPRWSEPGPARERLRGLIQFLRVFDRVCHGPKDQLLRRPLWDRSFEVSLLLGSLEYAQDRNADLLWSAQNLLFAIERDGAAHLAADVELTLRRHRAGVLAQMDSEEGSLQALSHELLSEEEWAGIASSMSCMPYPRDALYELANSVGGDPADRFRELGIAAPERRPLPPPPVLTARDGTLPA